MNCGIGFYYFFVLGDDDDDESLVSTTEADRAEDLCHGQGGVVLPYIHQYAMPHCADKIYKLLRKDGFSGSIWDFTQGDAPAPSPVICKRK